MKPKTKNKIKTKPENMLSSGSTLLNLACSNNPFGAFIKGKYYFLVGDSASGKTFLSMTCFAEALQHPHFKNYRLIYDNAEDGMMINLEKLFNAGVAKAVEAPGLEYSCSIEEFYYNLDDCIKKSLKEKRPFIYVLDSMDSLTSESEVEKFEQQKTAYKKGIKTAGSYGDGKAKKNSEGLRKALKGIQKTESILIIISQTRDNIGFGFEKKTRSGGHSLKFYATIELWSSVLGSIKKTVKGKKRSIGTHVQVKIKKNRIIGDLLEAQMDIYPSYGIDDIGSCIDYLVDEGWWNKSKQNIVAKEFEIELTREKLITHIEENNLHKKLQIVTSRCWKEIRQACGLERKRKY